MVALDPLWPERATVGGIVACNDSGALRLKYGGLRDLIIGMTMVLADGTIAKSGGKVVKNVAGYDMHKLMTGSFGTLGVIAEVNFRLHPVEEHRRTWTASGLVRSSWCGGFLAREPLHALWIRNDSSCVQLRVVRDESRSTFASPAPPECLGEYEDAHPRIFRGLAISESREEVWNARQQLFDDNDALVLKVAVLPSRNMLLARNCMQWTAGDENGSGTVAQATGIMTVAVHSATRCGFS